MRQDHATPDAVINQCATDRQILLSRNAGRIKSYNQLRAEQNTVAIRLQLACKTQDNSQPSAHKPDLLEPASVGYLGMHLD